ncbi:MAG: hypothetical protein ACRDVE_17865 [Actinocrinis sp.]
MKALTLSLGFATAVHSPALLPVLVAVVAAEVAYIVHSLSRKKVRHP